MRILTKTDNHVVIVQENIDSTNATQFEEELFSFISGDNSIFDMMSMFPAGLTEYS